MKTNNILVVLVFAFLIIGLLYLLYTGGAIGIVYRLLGIFITFFSIVLLKKAYQGYGYRGVGTILDTSSGRLTSPKKASNSEKFWLWFGTVGALLIGLSLMFGWRPTYIESLLF